MVLRNDKEVIFKSIWLKKFMYRLKSKSSLFYKLVRFIKYKHRYQAIYFFFEILEIIKPMLSTISKRRGKNFIEVPAILTVHEQYTQSIHWLASNITKNKEKKTPVIALCEKNRPGFWIMVHSDDFSEVSKELKNKINSIEIENNED